MIMEKKKFSEIDVLLVDLDETNISSILSKWKEIKTISKKITEFEDILKNKIKAYLREHKWDSHYDEFTDIKISIQNIESLRIDKNKVKNLLTESQYAKVLTKSVYEKLTIITPEMRKYLNDKAMGGDKK